MEIKIPDKYAGRPLRDFLHWELKVSAKLLARLKRDENGIMIGGRKVTVRYILSAGDTLTLTDYPEESGTFIAPVDLPVEIVYEDECLLVADKPPNMPTHPSHDHYDDTLANALAFRQRDSAIPYVFRPISRLDRDTSGLVTVAKTKYAASRMSFLMKQGGFEKLYFALLDGVLPQEHGLIDAPLHRTAASIITREVCSPDTPDAEPAQTVYRLLYTDGRYSLVLARPLTGRTHQLRVHFSHLGSPILGDTLYGRPNPIIGRQALHAAGLKFIHPISGLPVLLYSMPPDDFMQAAKQLFRADTEKILSDILNKWRQDEKV